MRADECIHMLEHAQAFAELKTASPSRMCAKRACAWEREQGSEMGKAGQPAVMEVSAWGDEREIKTHTPVRMHTHKSSKVCLECRNQEPEFSPTQFTTPGVSWDNRVTIKHSVVLFSSSFDPRVLGKSGVEVARNVRWGVVARGGFISYSGSTLAGKI